MGFWLSCNRHRNLSPAGRVVGRLQEPLHPPGLFSSGTGNLERVLPHLAVDQVHNVHELG